MNLQGVHHIAIICSDYIKSKHFYTDILGFKVESEYFRKERNSYKTDLSLNGSYLIELFFFSDPPERLSYPEAAGLRHLAFAVDDIQESVRELDSKGVSHEDIRVDEYTGKLFIFFSDPDGLPIELYER